MYTIFKDNIGEALKSILTVILQVKFWAYK